MSTPDPQTVREIARELILNHAKNLAQEDITVFESVIEKDICIPLSFGEQESLADDVLAEIGRAQIAVSWPDEQQDGAVEDVVAFLNAWEVDRGVGHAIRGGNGDMPYLFATDLRAVLAERTALAERVEELEAHPALLARADREADEADARAVNRLLRLAEADPALNYGPAATALRARFADRIAALDAHDAKVGG